MPADRSHPTSTGGGSSASASAAYPGFASAYPIPGSSTANGTSSAGAMLSNSFSEAGDSAFSLAGIMANGGDRRGSAGQLSTSAGGGSYGLSGYSEGFGGAGEGGPSELPKLKIRNKKSKPLHRNQACITCRGRKVRLRFAFTARCYRR